MSLPTTPTPTFTKDERDALYGDPTSTPIGLCPNCGGPCFGGAGVCSEKCGAEFTAYLSTPQ